MYSNPCSIDVKDVIESETSFVFGTDMFIGLMPDSVNDCIAIYDTVAFQQDARNSYDIDSIQVRSRAHDYNTAYTYLMTVRRKIEGIAEFTRNGTVYKGIWASSNVAFLKYDDQKRALFSINFNLIRVPIERGHRQ